MSMSDLEIDHAALQKLQGLEMASQQFNDPDACTAAITELRDLALANTPLSPFVFRVLEVLEIFLAIERIPKEPSSGPVYERLVFSAASALWSYIDAQSKNPDNGRLNDACVRILPKALQWINFFHAHFFGDVVQDIHLRENAWCGTLVFLGLAVRHPQMFSLYGSEITQAIVNLWVLEAALNTPFPQKHLPASLLHNLIAYHGEDQEEMITSAMESVGLSIAAQTAIHHLSSIIDTEAGFHFLEMRNETLLIRMMICKSSVAHSLLSRGVLRVLIKALSYATRESYTEDPATSEIMVWLVQNSCEALQVAMALMTTGVAMCRQALEFGILAPLLRVDKWHTRLSPAHFPNVPYIHSRLLIQTLATYTIYPCVLRAAAMAIEKVPVKLQADLDNAGPMRAAWKQFTDVVQKRLQVPGAPVGPFSVSICSNLFCPLLSDEDAKGASKRCSGCGDVVYCGSDCQRIDWKNHKKFCKEMQALTYSRPTVPKEETDFARKVALHELETHMNFILQKWRTAPDNHSPGTLFIHPNGRSFEYEENSHAPKIQVVIMNYEEDCTSDKPRPTIGFTNVPMFEHTGLPTMEESAQRYREEWKAIRLLAEKPQKQGMRAGIVVFRIPEGIPTVRKFFSLLPYSIS